MLDPYLIAFLQKPLRRLALYAWEKKIGADWISLTGFAFGILAALCIYLGYFLAAIVLIGLNRLADGVDGEVARLGQPSDAGAFLDIVLDFLFYAGIVTAFALAEPGQNGLFAAILLFSFIGTATSFLAFAIMAKGQGLRSTIYPQKGFYYLEGLTEATETVMFFILCCLFPSLFPLLATIFAVLCLITTAFRIYWGYQTLRNR